MPKRPPRLPIYLDTVGPPTAPLPAAGSRRFELARRRLAKQAHRDVEHVSDADVREFLAREQRAP